MSQAQIAESEEGGMNDPAYNPKTAIPCMADPTRGQLAEHLHYLCGDRDEDWRDGDWLQLAEAVLKIIHTRDTALLEHLCQQVREASLATGHADTPEELMAEVLEQVKALRLDAALKSTEGE